VIPSTYDPIPSCQPRANRGGCHFTHLALRDRHVGSTWTRIGLLSEVRQCTSFSTGSGRALDDDARVLSTLEHGAIYRDLPLEGVRRRRSFDPCNATLRVRTATRILTCTSTVLSHLLDD
jgi:hypothetical protein